MISWLERYFKKNYKLLTVLGVFAGVLALLYGIELDDFSYKDPVLGLRLLFLILLFIPTLILRLKSSFAIKPEENNILASSIFTNRQIFAKHMVNAIWHGIFLALAYFIYYELKSNFKAVLPFIIILLMLFLLDFLIAFPYLIFQKIKKRLKSRKKA